MNEAPTERDVGSTWASLRRRKVVQWSLLYTAGAWGFLQGLEYVTETFHWPERVRQVALLAAVIGLPLVLVLAWYHGDRGEQRVRGTELAIISLLFLAGGGIFWLYDRASERTAANSETRHAVVSIKDARPSIAVLPFENRSGAQDDVYFVDGIHDDILTQLSKVSALRVISRTSVERFRKSDLNVREIAQQLGVTSVLEGGVQRAGDRVRINVQLIDAATDAHLWAETYERALDTANLFAIQSELAAAIATALKASLTPAEKARADQVPTPSIEAWEAYQLGRRLMVNRTSSGLTEAEQHFRKAVALDPRFALAWVGLANALGLQAVYTGRPNDAVLPEADGAVARALELDPDLSEAVASAGQIAIGRLQFARAEELLRRAIELDPNSATARQWLSIALTELGRRNEALTMIESAVVLDPKSAILHLNLASALMNVGRIDAALAAGRQTIQLEPTMPQSYSNLGGNYAYGLGRYDQALPWFEKAASLDPGNPDFLAEVAYAYWQVGEDGEAERWLARVLALGPGTTYSNAAAALLNLTKGDLKSARRYAQSAAEMDPWSLTYLRDFDLRDGDYAAARARYFAAFPHLFTADLPSIGSDRDAVAAVELAVVLKGTGENVQAKALLDRSGAYLQSVPLRGSLLFYPVAVPALLGDEGTAVAELRRASQAGARSEWRYYRDFSPELASIRDDPEFKAIFADIERDMARQRAALAARPKGAPLELAKTGT